MYNSRSNSTCILFWVKCHKEVQLRAMQKNATIAQDQRHYVPYYTCRTGMTKGTMKFLLNASINTLPTANNLKQWGKRTSDKCQHCMITETTQHVLNGCKKFLEDGRYTWRHDNIVQYLWQVLKSGDAEVFADLPGKGAPGGGTVPADIVVTSERPDIVVVEKEMSLFMNSPCPLKAG